MKKLLALSGLALATSTTAFAVEQPYLGAAFVQSSYELASGPDASPALSQLRFGSDLSKRFGMEARASINAGDDTMKITTETRSVSVDSMYTLAATARMPFGEHASIYGMLGYSYAQVSFSQSSPSNMPAVEDNLDGMTFGAGLVLPAFKGFHLEVDYTSYMSGNDLLSGMGVGVRRYL